MPTDAENIALARRVVCGADTGYPNTIWNRFLATCNSLRQALTDQERTIPGPDGGSANGGPWWVVEKNSDDVAQQLNARWPAFGTNLNADELASYANKLALALIAQTPVEPPPDPTDPTEPTSPVTPNGLTATANADNTVLLRWEAVAAATSYRIYESVMSGNEVVAEVQTVESRRGPLAAGTYKYSVSAVNANGESVRSPETTVTVGATTPPPTTPTGPTPDPGNLLWAARFSDTEVRNSWQAGFGRIQFQRGGGSIQNFYNGENYIPGADHPVLGKCLAFPMAAGDMRREAKPGGGDTGYTNGTDLYFRVDTVFDSRFPIEQGDSFCLINQVHQASGSGSPPFELDVRNSAFYVRGASSAYNRKVMDIVRNKYYKVVYRLRFGSNPLVEVWVNDEKKISFVPPISMLDGGNSYWKGATMYCRSSIPPLTSYQKNHRVGRTYNSVAA